MKLRLILLSLLIAASVAGNAPKSFEDVVWAFMKGAKLDEYVVDSTNCLNAIDETAITFSDLAGLIKAHWEPESKVSFYPDVVLATTDVM